MSYLLYDGKRPVNCNCPPPPGVAQRSGTPLRTRVRIWNARQRDEAFSLDRHGFELRAHRSAVTVVFDHTLRLARQRHDERGVREPVRYVHNDKRWCPGRVVCAITCPRTKQSAG